MIPRPTASPSKGRRPASCTSSSTPNARGGGGRGTIDPQIVTTLLRRRRAYEPSNRLTPRERELVAWMAAGTQALAAGIEARVRRIRQCGALTVPGLLQTEGVHQGYPRAFRRLGGNSRTRAVAQVSALRLIFD